ncbi:putative Ig domain-containing protein [Geomicrobium sediminis]|uniref:Calcineurin-like phosphoesterase domain-containing protein n=1 Tax=Geomicrobium sediminis TaxID=1347788 RepID=A0ABS2P6T9_9BACL|nr:putative Ig domain-containing protein [Geomicrobium sediminis]MBM7631047.1 hypothetical protein [Geomicrobium sediminis]
MKVKTRGFRIASIPRRRQWATRAGFMMVAFGTAATLIAASTSEVVATEPFGATQGSFTDELQRPALMDFSSAPEEVLEEDDELWQSEQVGPNASPYQAFELEHPGEHTPVRWSGKVDPERDVSLLAWNHEKERWDQLRSESGSAPDNTVLKAYLSEDYRDVNDAAHIAIVGEDSSMTRTGNWKPDSSGVTDDFRDPETYDFSMAHITDTQFLAEGAVDPELDEDAQERFASAYRDKMNWIVDNQDQRKIAYVAHTGDIIENWMLPHHSEEQAQKEFGFASDMQAIIDEAGIPNGILPGNHDNGWGAFGNDMFNDYFSQERYEEASQSWENGTYGGPWQEGDNSAHYDLFEVDDHEFIAVHLPYGHTNAQRNWANEVLEAFPNRDAFLFTHSYLRASSSDDATKASGNRGYGDNSHLLRTQVVEKNDNIVMVSSGHYHGTAWNQNFNGNNGPVFEMLADYQNYEVDGERNTGFMRLLQFDIDAGEVTVNTYSPKLGEFNATDYDTGNRNYQPETDEYTAPLSLSTRGTTVMTDQIQLGNVDQSVAEPPENEPKPIPYESPKRDGDDDQQIGQLNIRQQDDLTVKSGEEISPIDLFVNDDDAAIEFEGLPEGMVGVADSRTISGVPTEPGTYEITVTAFNQFEVEETMSFSITVEETE